MPTLFLSDLFPAINRNHHLVYFHSRLKGKRAERKGKKGKEKKKKKKSFLETGYSRKATPTVDPPLTHTQASAMNTFFSFFFLSFFIFSFFIYFFFHFIYPFFSHFFLFSRGVSSILSVRACVIITSHCRDGAGNKSRRGPSRQVGALVYQPPESKQGPRLADALSQTPAENTRASHSQ